VLTADIEGLRKDNPDMSDIQNSSVPNCHNLHRYSYIKNRIAKSAGLKFYIFELCLEAIFLDVEVNHISLQVTFNMIKI